MAKHAKSRNETSFQGRRPAAEETPAAAAPEVQETLVPDVQPSPKPAPIDMATAFPAALEEFNRSAVHVMDRATSAFARAKTLGPREESLTKMNEAIAMMHAVLPVIDEIAPKPRA